jgi:23S rRNA (pseudouridine1915-N3)-methyltransferase
MKLRIISVGHKMPSWVETACSEYTKRMPREAMVEIVEIKPENAQLAIAPIIFN